MRMTPLQRVDRARTLLYLSALILAAGCASAPGPSPTAAADPALEARLQDATRPQSRLHVVFDWSITDRDARFNGQGVLRLDTTYRGRVDLFGPRGETLAAAIVENDAMRVVPAQATALLPPPALLWSLLGAFRPPVGTPFTGSSDTGGATMLHYAQGSARWSFRFEGGALRSTEWTDGTGRRTVTLSGASSAGLPAETTFRDWSEFRELTLRVTTVEEKTAFEPDVWILPGER